MRERSRPGYVAEEVCSEWAGIGAVGRVYPLGITRPLWASLGTPGNVRQHRELLGITGHHRGHRMQGDNIKMKSTRLLLTKAYNLKQVVEPSYNVEGGG